MTSIAESPLSRTLPRSLADWLVLSVLLLFAAFYLAPLYLMGVTGLKGAENVSLSSMWNLPTGLSAGGFAEAWRRLFPNLINSLEMTIPATIISSVLGAVNGYIFAKWKFKGSNFLFTVFVFGMFIPYQSILIPLIQFLHRQGSGGVTVVRISAKNSQEFVSPFGVMSFLPLNELPALFPHVVDWISYLEKQAQESGRAFSPIEFNLAQNVGVAHPEEVRILSVLRIPLPPHPRVKQLARQVGLLNADTGGLTAGYGVIVRLDCKKNLRLLAHEFVHVAQYERLGREGFLQEYIQQIAAHGYLNAPFEQEAEAKAERACRDAGI